MKNSEAKGKLNIKYGARCLLTNVKLQKGSYHHIIKKEFGGQATVENGANLVKEIHQWLHNEIETKNIEQYHLINECLMLYKKCLDTNNRELIEMYENECMPLFYEKYIEYKNRPKVKTKRR